MVILLILSSGIGIYLAIGKFKKSASKKEIIEQRIVYTIKTGGSDYLSDIEIYSTKLDGMDKKLIAKAKKEDLISLNSRIWPFYDAIILRGQNTPFAIFDNEGNDLSLKYKTDNFEFAGYVLDFSDPSLSSDGNKSAFILNGDKGFGSNLKTCSGGQCFINIRDLNTGQITPVQIKFDVWSLGEFLTIGWTEDQKYILGTGCNTTGCTVDGFETHSTWAINLDTQETKIYGEGNSPPFLLLGTNKFIYSRTDPRCKGDQEYLLISRCAIKLVDLETGSEVTLAYNASKNASITPLRHVKATNELFFLENPRLILTMNALIRPNFYPPRFL